MKRIIAVAAISTCAVMMLADAGATAQVKPRTPVSKSQYQILLNQCQYAGDRQDRSDCRARVRATYRLGATNPNLDCRTYSGFTVCGELVLNASQCACVRDSVNAGLSYRRAEVECYVDP